MMDVNMTHSTTNNLRICWFVVHTGAQVVAFDRNFDIHNGSSFGNFTGNFEIGWNELTAVINSSMVEEVAPMQSSI